MADIQLSSQLIQDIQAVVQRQQPDADGLLLTQYLAAVAAYLVASDPQLEDAHRGEFLEELCAFAQQVLRDVQTRQRNSAPTQQASAFGYWEPGQD